MSSKLSKKAKAPVKGKVPVKSAVKAKPAKSAVKRVHEEHEPDEFTAEWAIAIDLNAVRRAANLQIQLGARVKELGNWMAGSARDMRAEARSERVKDDKLYISRNWARESLLSQMNYVAMCESALMRCREAIELQKAAYLKAAGVEKIDWCVSNPGGMHPEALALLLEHPDYERIVKEYHAWCRISTDITQQTAWEDRTKVCNSSLTDALALSDRFKKHLETVDPVFAATVDPGHIYQLLLCEQWNPFGDLLTIRDADDEEDDQLY